MMKRIICTLAAVLILLSSFAVYAFAENEKLLPEFMPESSQDVEDEYSIEYSEELESEADSSEEYSEVQETETDSFEELAEIAETEAAAEPSTTSVEIPAVIPSTRQAPRLVDYADIIPDGEESEILTLLDSISEKKQFDIVIVTTESTGSRTSMEFADDYFDYGGFGYGDSHEGIVLMIDYGGGNYWISASGEKGRKIFSSSECDYLSNYFIDELVNEDFSSACRNFADGASSRIDSFKRRPFVLIPISLLIGFIISSVSASGIKSKHQTVVPKVAATSYKVADSLILATKNDNFLYSNVSRMPIVQQVKAPVGGGGIHMSSSGNMHTGSGGSFR